MDPNIEGPIDCTPDRRAEARKYIQERIRVQNSILCYYKRRLNSLNIVCRLPTEILTNIFRLVVDDYELIVEDTDAQSDGTDTNPDENHIPWIQRVTHVCSHWREVALSTPNLWSTIHLDCPTWALEMLRRSKGVELTVVSYGPMYRAAYNVLYQVLAFHLHRIKILTVWEDRVNEYRSVAQPWVQGWVLADEEAISVHNFRVLLQLLGQHNGPLKIERLGLSTDAIKAPVPFTRITGCNLQDAIITALPSLKHLELQGLEINWGLLHTFKNLETLHILAIPDQSQPSLFQVLCFLSQIPRLASLEIEWISDDDDQVMPDDGYRIYLKCIKRIAVSCQDVSILGSFFDHVAFSKDSIVSLVSGMSIVGEDMEELVEESNILIPQSLVLKMDNTTDGLVSELDFSPYEIKCWKSRGRRLVSFSPPGEPVLRFHCYGLGLLPPFRITILRSLRLDQLVSLELREENKGRLDMEELALLGSLPRVTQLKIHHIFSDTVFQALCHEMHFEWQIHAHFDRGLHPQPAFPAMRTLAIRKWNFQNFYDRHRMTTFELFYDCVKLRIKAGVPISVLQIESCSGCEENHVSRLRNLINVVDWDHEDRGSQP
ncbi:hypothetical protein H0H92_004339 [Tricholoma furcatifolium]|nr:hypothetical protein H0H92_004339 [Tricholoma furcatifolium]